MDTLQIISLVFTILLGISIGSFLNVCIYRIPNHNFFDKSRSYCPNCKAEIKWYDNIPVFSYIFLGGRCRNCHQRISPIYPIVELTNLGLYIGIFFKFGVNYITIIYCLVASILIVMSFIDLKTTEIPDTVHILIIVLALITFAPIDNIMWQSKLIGAVCVSVPLFVLAFFGGMGGGDVKLFFALGLLLGVGRIVITFFVAVVLGGIAGGIILLVKKKQGRKYEMPFGPYIAIGAMVAMFFGEPIIAYYTEMFTVLFG